MNLKLVEFQIWKKIRIIAHALVIMINQLVINIDLDSKIAAAITKQQSSHRQSLA